MKKSTCIALCHCMAGVIPQSIINDISRQVRNLNVDLYELKDICAAALDGKSLLNEITVKYRHKLILACYPRAVDNILKQGGIDFGDYRVVNLRDRSAVCIKEELQKDLDLNDPGPARKFYTTKLMVPAWYPVVDSSRCTLCGKCSRFCLFGVYKFDGKSLRVANPLSCKNNCPACGRLCPESAIIFPKWQISSVLSGADPGMGTDTGTEMEKIDRLIERNRKRKMIFREDFANRISNGKNNDPGLSGQNVEIE